MSKYHSNLAHDQFGRPSPKEDEPVLTSIKGGKKTSGLKSKPEILIVDDDSSFLEMISVVFTDFVILKASNGKIALDMIRESSPDLIITDLIMPEMDGFDLIQELKSKCQIPVIAMSGYDFESAETKKKIIKDHTARFLQKPFQLADIETAVRETLNI